MKTVLKSFLFGLICLSMFSCASNEATTEQQGQTKVTFSVDQFISSDATSRSTVNPSNNYAVTWASGDVIGIFPREGYQEPFSIPTDQVGQSKATFDGGYWALKDGLTYNAYYPFDKASFESAECKTTIPVTYLGQSQNGTTCNAGAFDYTYSDWTEATSGSTNFKFHHLGAFLVLTLNIPATATYTTLTLNANSSVIPTTGTYDLTASAPAFTAKTYASSLTMTLNGFSGTAGEDATFYMMMPPCDLSSATLTATLSTGTTNCTYDITSHSIQAAHLYKVTGTPKESSVDGTIDGWVTEEQSLINGHEYVEIGGIKWATMNIGATTIAESPSTSYGNYFAWGAIETWYDKITWNNTIPSFTWKSGKLDGYTEQNAPYYTYNSSNNSYYYMKYKLTDSSNTLENSDDIANLTWKEGWRMPTSIEFNNLIQACNTGGITTATIQTDLSQKGIYWIPENIINGYAVAGLLFVKDISHKLFFPAAGGIADDNIFDVNAAGIYWSSSLGSSTNFYASSLMFTEKVKISSYNLGRYRGQPIRPVHD